MNGDEQGQSKSRSANQKTAGSNEYDVQIEALRLESLKDAKSSNENDVEIARQKSEEMRASAALDHTLDMMRENYKNEQHYRETIASVGKWTLVCTTFLIVQIFNISSRTAIAAEEAKFGTAAGSRRI